MNLLVISGNLGRDAETRATKSGGSLVTFSLPVNSGWGDNKKTTWVRCLLMGKRAESGIVSYLTKGQGIEVAGEFGVSEWTDGEGKNRWSVDLVVEKIGLIGSKRESSLPSTGEDAPF